MKIAVASGKGGTGKTTVSVALASSINTPIKLLDCDVEEPNCNIFLNLKTQKFQSVYQNIPEINLKRCVGCGACSEFCEFNALVTFNSKTLLFPELCHGCGGCKKICPNGAISEIKREVGSIEIGSKQFFEFIEGRLNIGEAMAPPVIKEVKSFEEEDIVNIIDCPPGNSCSLLAAVKGCDYVLLVTEPTPFGLHDLSIAVETMRILKLPFGVIINRVDQENNLISEYCESEGIRVILQIPEDMRVAKAYSRGENLISVFPDLKVFFENLPNDLLKLVPDQNHESPGK